MRVIIVGGSKVGYALTKHICEEGFDVVIIDKDEERIGQITDAFDCNGYVGNGGSPGLLKKAGIDSASLLIAVTKSDETNIMCCGVAKKLGVKRTIAAVRGPEYGEDRAFFFSNMGVDMQINPEKSAAEEVAKLIKYAGAVEIEHFGDGNVNVATVQIREDSVLADALMPEVQARLGAQILVCAIDRGGKMITPKGRHQIKAGDKITFAAAGEETDKALKQLNILKKVVRKAVIVGGSKLGYYLTKSLLSQGVKVTLVDSDPVRCRELLQKLPKADIVNANGADAEFMEKALKGADACAAVTGKDEENLIISMFAKSFGLQRIAAEIDNQDYEDMLKKSGIDHVFSTRDVGLGGILRDARLLSIGGEKDNDNVIKRLYTLNSGKVEAAEFEVDGDFKLLGMEFKNPCFALKSGVLIAMIVRGQETIVPDGSSSLQKGDRIFVVSAEHKIARLADILA